MCYPLSKLCPRLIANCAQTARSTLLLIKNGLELWSCSVIHCSVYYPAIKCVQLPGYYVSSMCFVPPQPAESLACFIPRYSSGLDGAKTRVVAGRHIDDPQSARRGAGSMIGSPLLLIWNGYVGVYSFAALTLPLLSCAGRDIMSST